MLTGGKHDSRNRGNHAITATLPQLIRTREWSMNQLEPSWNQQDQISEVKD